MVDKVAEFGVDKDFAIQARKLLDRDFYPNVAWQGRFVVLSDVGGSLWLQKHAHMDVVVQTGLWSSATVEEKIVRKKHPNFAIETHANWEKSQRTGKPDGWIYRSVADWLVYAFRLPDGLEVWQFPLPDLRQWFYREQHHLMESRMIANGEGGIVFYHSKIMLAPIEDVEANQIVRTLKW